MVSKKCSNELDAPGGYIVDLPDALKEKAEKFIEKLSSKKKNGSNLGKKEFLRLLKYKFLQCLAQPGEPVGLLAAQSVGEPSTQMT